LIHSLINQVLTTDDCTQVDCLRSCSCTTAQHNRTSYNCRLRAPRTVRSCAVVRSAFSETGCRGWSLNGVKI